MRAGSLPGLIRPGICPRLKACLRPVPIWVVWQHWLYLVDATEVFPANWWLCDPTGACCPINDTDPVGLGVCAGLDVGIIADAAATACMETDFRGSSRRGGSFLLWTRCMCWESELRLPNALPHKRHANFFCCSCTTWTCLRRSDFWPKRVSHRLHLWFRSRRSG